MAAVGIEAPIGKVPWSQVGPGWALALWSPVTPTHPGEPPPPGQPTYETSATTLYLVDPAGGRYLITAFPPPGDKAGPELAGWSGDGSHALFYVPSDHSTAVIVDLHTGAQTTAPVDGRPRFTLPEGKALLLESDNGASTLTRVDLAGHHQLTYPTDKLGGRFNGSYLSTPDGTRLVLGTSAGLVLMGNDGKVGSPLSVPGSNCRPLRWWDGKTGGTVLATCDVNVSTMRLWLVPIGGGPATPLTAPNNGQDSPDLNDMNAWHLPAGTFVQAAGGCGSEFLAKLNANGTTTPVSVPEVNKNSSVRVIGVDGPALDLQAEVSCGPGQSLLRYDPAANTSTVLLGPPVNGGGVVATIPYPGQE
ncbi:MAG TPA: hypothetical protein VFB19_20975 [Mycobacterium sp.]|nr:hypothetical protein [Mycobacterium sp.]